MHMTTQDHIGSCVGSRDPIVAVRPSRIQNASQGMEIAAGQVQQNTRYVALLQTSIATLVIHHPGGILL